MHLNDPIVKCLMRVRDELMQKRSSYKGQLDVQSSIEHRQKIDKKINQLTSRIDEVNDCITLRMSEKAEEKTIDVSAARCGERQQADS